MDNITLLNAIGLKTATFTAATTGIITSNAHGLVTGNRITVSSATTLPAGLSATAVYTVVKINANTFKLTTEPYPSDVYVAIGDEGTGTHTFVMHDVCIPLLVQDFDVVELSVATDGGGDAALTLKVQGSNEDTAPDFSAAQSAANMWDYLDMNDLEDGSSIDGDTGFAVAGADDYRMFEVNVNRMRWLSVIISGWTAGEVTVKAKLAKN